MASKDSEKLRILILQNLIVNNDYTTKILPFLKEEYFVLRKEVIVYEEIHKYFTQYGSPAPKEAIAIGVDSRTDLTEVVYNEIQQFLEMPMEPFKDPKFLFKVTEEWCRERATVNAITKGVNVIGGEDKKMDMGGVIELLRDATSLQFDTKIGHDYIEDAENRWQFYHEKEDKLKSGLNHFDYILRGGFPSKSLGVILAGTGVGKSLFMCGMASNVIKSGNNVLYITMEMAEEKISQRIDQNLMNSSLDELEGISKIEFMNRIEDITKKTHGRLMVKEYPTKSAHAGHFEVLLKELEQKKDFKPDLICVDYLNICKSLSAHPNANSYEQSKSVAEELRAIAMKYNLPVLTATQTNRSGYSDTDVDMTSTSESFGVPMTADYMLALVTNDQLKESGQVKLIQLKNRYGDPSDRKSWMLEVDYTHMKIKDMDNQPDILTASNEAEASPPIMNFSGSWN